MKWIGITLCLMTSLMTSCGMRVDTSGDQDVNIRAEDSEQTITVRTTLDRILEICGIIKEDGTVVPYSKWTDDQEECLTKLKPEGSDGEIDRLKEQAEEG